MKKKYFLSIAALMAMATLAGCSSTTNSTESQSSTISDSASTSVGMSESESLTTSSDESSSSSIESQSLSSSDSVSSSIGTSSELSSSTESQSSSSSESSSSSSSIPVHEHVYGEWTLITEPTLEAEGSASRSCVDGDDVETVVVPALSDGSVWTKDDTRHEEPGCETEGKDVYTSIYGEVEVILSATGHVGSGTYDLVEDETTVSIYEQCVNNDSSVGEAIETVTRGTGAEVTEHTPTSEEDALDSSEGFAWTQGTDGGWYSPDGLPDASGKCEIRFSVTKAGVLSGTYAISSESSDKFYMTKNFSGVSGAYGIGGNSSDTYKTGSFSFEVAKGDIISLKYAKDSSVSKGHDNVIVYFKEYNYTMVSFESNGGSTCLPQIMEDKVIVNDLPTPTREGYYFEGWCSDEELTRVVSQSDTISGNTLYAKWSKQATITLHLNGGSIEGDATSINLQAGETPSITDPTREDYYFIGWYIDADFANEYTPSAVTEGEEINLYAKWIAQSDAYSLFGSWGGFKFNASSNSISFSDSYVQLSIDETGKFSLRTAYNGYESGTFEDIDSSTGKITTSLGEAYYDSTIDAIYMCPSSTITSSSYWYVILRGKTISKSNVQGTAINSGAKQFVTFPVDEGTSSIMVDLSAEDNKILNNVSFKDMEGNEIAAGDLKTQLSFDVIQNETVIASFGAKTGSSSSFTEYVSPVDSYRGIYTSSDGKTIKISGGGRAWFDVLSYPDSSITSYEEISENQLYVYYSATIRYIVILDVENMTFTYEERKVNITYHYNYLDVDGNEVFSYGTAVYDYWSDLESSPTREGYEFDGWYDNAELTGSAVTRGKYTTDTDFYAKWTKLFTVSFEGADGVEALTVRDGETVSLPSPTVEDNAQFFEGWYTDAELLTAYDSTQAVTSDLVLYAKWSDALVITTHTNYDEDVITYTNAQNGKVPTITSPTRSGYGFQGWYTDAACSEGNEFDTTAPLIANVELYAKWGELPPYVTTYQGFNLYSTSDKGTTKSMSSSYGTTISEDGSGTNKLSGYTIQSVSSDGLITFDKSGSSYYGTYVYSETLGIPFIITYYSAPNNDAVPNDMDFMIGTSEKTITVKSTCLTTSPKRFLLQVIVNGKSTLIYVDTNSNKVYADVTVSTDTGEGFDLVYADGAFANTVTISSGETTIASFTKSGSSLVIGE